MHTDFNQSNFSSSEFVLLGKHLKWFVHVFMVVKCEQQCPSHLQLKRHWNIENKILWQYQCDILQQVYIVSMQHWTKLHTYSSTTPIPYPEVTTLALQVTNSLIPLFLLRDYKILLVNFVHFPVDPSDFKHSQNCQLFYCM